MTEDIIITSTMAKYSYTGHPKIASSICRAKSWDLNYPAISFMLNGGYYADYASIMSTMGLSTLTMHHSTWDNVVLWVGPHVDRLANWSGEQVRADIEECGDQSQWMAGLDGLYLTRVIILTMLPLPCMMYIFRSNCWFARSQWMAGFDGFYLTRGHHSNNASATLHDVYSDRIGWFAHRTKRGKDSKLGRYII